MFTAYAAGTYWISNGVSKDNWIYTFGCKGTRRVYLNKIAKVQ